MVRFILHGYINYGHFRLSFHLSRKINIKIYAFIIVPFAVYRRETLELSRFGEGYKPSVGPGEA
jgi:hypothetical protein